MARGQPLLGQAAQRAPAGNAVRYERRRPEESVLYRLIQYHAERFFAQVEAQTGASLTIGMQMNFTAGQIANATGMIEMQMADEHHVDVSGGEPEPR